MIALLLAALLQAAPAARPTVLVVPPQGTEDSAWIAEAVAESLPTTLTELGVDAVARADRLQAHEELEIPLVDLSRATVIRVAEALDANRVVLGTSEVSAANEVTLSLRVLDVERGTLSAPLLATGRVADLRDLVDGLAFDLALALAATPSTSREALHARHAAVPAEAWETHARSLVARSVDRVRLARRAVEQAPGYNAARMTLAGLLVDAREFSAAHDVLARVPPDSPHARRARFLMGVCLLEIGRYPEAAALFGALVADKPTAAALNDQGLAVLRTPGAHPVPATELLRRAVDLSPGYAPIAFNLGWAFLHEKQPLAAEYWLRGVLTQEPLHGAARVALAWALHEAGQAAKAEEEWKGVVAIVPDWQGHRATDLSRRFERVLSSERLLTRGQRARSDAEVAATLAARGERLFESGDLNAALRELKRAAYLDPYKPRVHAALARVHRARGERDKAENEFRMALWSADDPQVRLELAALLAALGRAEEARREAGKVLAADPSNAAAQAIVNGPS